MVSLATLALVLGEVVGLFDRLVGLTDRSIERVIVCVTSLAVLHSAADMDSGTVTFLCWIYKGNQGAEEWTDTQGHGNIACGWRSYVDFGSPEGFLPPLTYFPCLFFDRRFSEWSAVLMDITYLGLWILGKGVLTGWVGQQVLRD
jgi:hypothetical protein